MTELPLPNPALGISRWLSPVAATLGGLITSPILIIHFCSAGSRIFEIAQGILVCLVAGVVAATSRTRGRRLAVALVAPLASFALTQLYFTWIHSSVSPWPARDPKPAFESADNKQPE